LLLAADIGPLERSSEKAELGRLLFFDPRLSADGTIACATCHNPSFAFTDGAPVSTGIRGQKGTRRDQSGV
jgi:cytochrome c peroxidase